MSGIRVQGTLSGETSCVSCWLSPQLRSALVRHCEQRGLSIQLVMRAGINHWAKRPVAGEPPFSGSLKPNLGDETKNLSIRLEAADARKFRSRCNRLNMPVSHAMREIVSSIVYDEAEKAA